MENYLQHLEGLNDDTLEKVCKTLDTQDLVNFATASKRVAIVCNQILETRRPSYFQQNFTDVILNTPITKDSSFKKVDNGLRIRVGISYGPNMELFIRQMVDRQQARKDFHLSYGSLFPFEYTKRQHSRPEEFTLYRYELIPIDQLPSIVKILSGKGF